MTSLAPCLLVPLLLILWTRPGRLHKSPWPAVAVIAWYGYGLAHGAVDNVRNPREWDYACFWLYGHLAAAHQNIYDPAAFRHAALPFTPSAEFRSATLDVGFPYPPPSIALFLPLGYIANWSLGLALWYLTGFAALGGAAWTLARTLMPRDGRNAAVLVLAIVVALPAAQMTVNNAQTNFVLLLVLSLALAGRESPAGAIWQILAVWIKPYAAVFALLEIVRADWRRLAVAAATVALSSIAAASLVGPDALRTFLQSNPAGREPSFAFVEAVNQSLLAAVLRLHPTLPAHIAPLHEPLYVGLAVLLSAFSLALCMRARGRGEVAFATTLVLGLLLYPGTLSSYEVVLALPLLVVWNGRAHFAGGSTGAAALIGAAVALQSGLLHRGFEANILVWIGCAYLLAVKPGTVEELLPETARVNGLQAVGAG